MGNEPSISKEQKNTLMQENTTAPSVLRQLLKDYNVIYLSEHKKTKIKRNYPNNYVTTSKYTLINFLPKSLFLQFKRYANIYFLIVMILQCIPIISPLNPITAFGPFLLVLAISIFREGVEDCTRHREDSKENAQKVQRYNTSTKVFEETESKNLEVGDVIIVKKDGVIPADCVLLYCNNQSKIAYVMTANLDGEKNLKPRYVHPDLFRTFSKSNEFFRMRGKMKFMLPQPELNAFNGTIHFNNTSQIQLDAKHCIYKGTLLGNTKYAIGLVVYTGKNTKIVKNSQKAAPKQSHLEEMVNYLIGLIFLIQFFLWVILAALNSDWYAHNWNTHQYLMINVDYMFDQHISGFIGYLSYILLLNTMIPISLIVTLEVVKYGQAFFMNIDCEMFSSVKSRFAKCNSCSLNEELGQIKYIFSDKTGTLTANKLEFTACAIADELFGMTPQELENSDGKTLINRKMRLPELKVTNKAMPIVYSFQDYEVKDYVLQNKTGNDFNIVLTSNGGKSKLILKNTSDIVIHFFYCLCLNHTCCIEKSAKKGIVVQEPRFVRTNTKSRQEFLNSPNTPLEKKSESVASVQGDNLMQNLDKYDITYTGENPDEIILCDTASHVGFMYCGGDETVSYISRTSRIMDEKIISDNHKWEKLKTIPFTSARGKMTVIVRRERERQIILYCKGGNTKIEMVLRKDSQPFLTSVKEKTSKLSEMGLRVLWIAMKIIDDDEYDKWKKEFEAIPTKDVEAANSKIREIEMGMTLIGCTAVEDNLQDKVPDTIKELQIAGINIWVLTGDNLPTARNIAISCKLLPPGMDIYEIYEDLNKFMKAVRDKAGNQELFSPDDIEEASIRIGAFENLFPQAYELKFPPKSTPEEQEEKMRKSKERKAVLLIGLENMFRRYKQSEIEHPGILRGVLVEGAMLEVILPSDDFKQLRYYLHPLAKAFLDLTLNSQAVVCCRVSPLQKAQVVRMIKKNVIGAITLAIGDGANDVSMINEAHVGVGIFGEEGTQAAMASDYAIGDFKCLKRLLLFHGRMNYTRIAVMILYFFFKNFLFTIPQFYFAFYSAFSGQTLYDDWFVSLYNMIFTSCPLLVRALFEQDINEDDGEFIKQHIPYTYYQGREGLIFNLRNFFLNILEAICISICVFFFVEYMMHYSVPLDGYGRIADFWATSLTQFTAIIFIVNYKLLINTSYHTWINILVMIVMGYGMYIGYFVVSSLFLYSKSSSTMDTLFTSHPFYLIIFLLSAMSFIFDWSIKFVSVNFYDEPITLLRRHLRTSYPTEQSKREAEERLSRTILRYDENVRNLHKVTRVSPHYMERH